MSQVLDTKVDTGGFSILDNQSITAATGVIGTITGGANASGITAIIIQPGVYKCTPGNASGQGITATLRRSNIIPTILGNATGTGILATLRRGFKIVAIPSVTTANGITASVTGTLYLDYFTAKIRHKTTGATLTGLTTVTIALYQPSTGYRLDFFDGQFKLSPTISSATVPEFNSSTHPGVYRLPIGVSGWNGWVNWEITYNDGSYTYNYNGERYYISSIRSDGVPTSPTSVATSVWGHPVSSVVDPNTMGIWLYTKVLTVGKFLGLK